jgi:hypothetical protein
MRHMGHALGSKSSGFLLVLGLVLLGFASVASAASLDKKSTAEAKKATQLYKQGSYEEAAALFLQLSLDNPGMPVFVRNLGACYYYLRRPEPALSNLHEYLLKKKDIDPQDRQEVERWIAEMDELRRGGASAGARPVLPTDSTAAQPAPGMGAGPAPGMTPPSAPGQPPYPPYQTLPPAEAGYPAAPAWATAVPMMPPGPDASGGAWPAAAVNPAGSSGGAVAAQPEHKSSGRVTAAWILGGVGVAALVTGGVCTLMANSKFSDVEKKYDPGKESDGKTFATVQWIGYGVGAAAVTTAVILAVTGKSSSGPVALAPTVAPGQAGAVVSGRF